MYKREVDYKSFTPSESTDPSPCASPISLSLSAHHPISARAGVP